MAEKSKSIQSSKAKSNIKTGYIPYKNTKKNQRKVKSAFNGINWFVLILVLVLSLGAGVGAFFVVCRNDCFTLNGSQEVCETFIINQDNTITANYTDEDFVTVIEFGKDISNKVTVETDMTQNPDGTYSVNEVGTYYIKYKVDSIKYGKLFTIEKIRLVTFVEPSEPSEKFDD